MTIFASFTRARLFLRTLQRAPEPVRRKWQRGISAVAFVVIIAGWVLYLNATLGPPTAPAETMREEGGFFETLGKGFGVFGSTLSEEWAKLRTWGGALWSELDAQVLDPSVFTFVREDSAFTPAPYEPVPPATLPVTE